MKINFVKSILALAAILMLNSCEQTSNGPQLENRTISMASVDDSRLINYNTVNDDVITTKSAKTGTVDLATEVPAGAQDMSVKYENWSVAKKDVYVVPAGQSITTGLKYDKEVAYYVEGELTVTSAWGSEGTIYVMEGGVLNYLTNNLADKNTIINGGTLNLSSTFSIGNNGEIQSATPITVETKLAFDGGKFISDAMVTAGRLQFNTSSNYDAIFNSCVYAGHVEFSNSAATFNSCLIVDGDISCIKGYIALGDDVLIQCENLYYEYTGFKIKGQDNNYSVIDADKIILRQDNYMKSFDGCIDIHGELDNQSGKALKWQSSVIFNGETVIAGDECKPAFGVAVVEGPKTYTLKHISQLEPAEADLSATALCFEDNLTYLSWHKAGEEYKGWIDVLDLKSTDLGQELYIKSSLDAPDVDFNHINASDAEICIVGDNLAGALVAFVDYNESGVELNTLKIKGTSGNSLIQVGDKFVAVSGGADGVVTTIDVDSKTVVAEVSMPYAKSVFDNAGETNVLYNVNGVPSQVANLTDDSKSFSVGDITPVNGKNTCVADADGKIYVSMGSAGLKVFENGVAVTEFVNPTGSAKGYAVNCVAVDDEFVYVAYGALGLFVLDKSDYSVVATYKYADASANFVLKDASGLIYVAYGTSGVHVLQLEEVL